MDDRELQANLLLQKISQSLKVTEYFNRKMLEVMTYSCCEIKKSELEELKMLNDETDR